MFVCLSPLLMDASTSNLLGWLCVGVTTLFGVSVFYTAKRSPAEKANLLLWSLLPTLLGLLCVAMLGTAGGLVVFCTMCLLSVYLGNRALLPVGDKAVLITGRVLQTCSGKQKLAFLTSGMENFVSLAYIEL